MATESDRPLLAEKALDSGAGPETFARTVTKPVAARSALAYNAERRPDLLVSAPRDQHFQNLLLTMGKGYTAGREDSSRGGTHALDEH
jgi:hypothetical protein